MRTVDFRFLTILVVSVLVIGGACHALHEYQLTRQQGVYIREADRVCGEGKPGSAVDYLKSYLRLVPEDVDQRLRLARILRELGIAGQSQSYYTQVIQGGGIEQFDAVEQATIRYERATVAMRLGLNEIAKTDLEGVLEQMDSDDYRQANDAAANLDEQDAPVVDSLVDARYGAERIVITKADADELLGICLIRLEDYEGAKDSFKNAFDRDKSRLGSYLAFAELCTDLMTPSVPAEAVAALQEMIDCNTGSADAFASRGQFFLEHARDAEFQDAVLADMQRSDDQLEAEEAESQESEDSGEGGILDLVESDTVAPAASAEQSAAAEAAAREAALVWWALTDARDAVPEWEAGVKALEDAREEASATGEEPGAGEEPGVAEEPANDADETANEDGGGVVEQDESRLRALLIGMRAANTLLRNTEAEWFATEAIAADEAVEADESLSLPYAVLAEVELRRGSPVDAARILNDGIDACGDDPYLLWLLANVQIQQNEIGEAEDVVAKMEGNPDLAPFSRLLRGRIHFANGKLTEARSVLEGVQGTLPDGSAMEVDAKYWLARTYQALGETDLAVTACDEALALDRNSWQANLLRAGQYATAGDSEKAIEFYERAGRLSGNIADEFSRAALLSVQRNTNLLWTAGRRTEAAEYLAGVRGRLREQSGAYAPSVEISVYGLEALVLEGLEEFEAAERLLEEAVQLYPDEQDVWLARVGLTLRRGDFAGTGELLDAAEAQLGETVRLRMARVQLAHAITAVDGIDPELELGALIEEFRRLAIPREAWAAEEPDTANAQLAASVGLYAAQSLQRSLATAAERRLALDLAEEQLRLAAERAPEDVGVRLLLFDLALARNQVGRADVPEEEDFKPDPQDWSRAGTLMADMLRQLGGILDEGNAFLNYGEAIRLALEGEFNNDAGKYDGALRKLELARIDRPEWDRIPALEGRILLAQDKRGPAVEAFLRAIALGSQDTELIGLTMSLLIEQGRYQDAAGIVNQLGKSGDMELADRVPDLAQRAFELSLRTNDGGLSELAFNSIRQRTETSRIASDHLLYGLMLRQRGEMDEAERSFRTAVDLGPGDPGNWLALIIHLVNSGQEQAARDTIVAADASIAADQRTLAMARAYEILAEFNRSVEDVEQAETDLARARTFYLEVIEIPDGEAPPAEFARRLRGVADFHLRQSDLPAAEELLRKILEQSDATAEDARFARRNLGVILLSRGTFRDLRSALDEVNQNLAKAGEMTVVERWRDERLRAMIYSRWPTREHRAEAIRDFEKLIRESQIVLPTDQAALAELHLAERAFHRNMAERSTGTDQSRHERLAAGELSHALDLLRRLATDTHQLGRSSGELTDEQARYLALYAETLLENNQVGEARRWAGILAGYLPDRAVSVLLNAEVAFRGGDHDRARRTLDEYLGGLSEETTGNVVPVVAARLEGFADRSRERDGDESIPTEESRRYLAEAERLFTAHGARTPDQSLVLAGFLARQDRIDEAVEMMEREWTGNSDAALSSAATFVLQNVRDDDGSLERLNGLLLQAVEARPESLPITLVAADVCAWRKDVSRAIGLYAGILEQNPGDVVAGNNLAFLRATEARDQETALRLIDDAIELQGPVPALLDTRAVVLLSLGRYEDALSALSEAEQQLPSAGYQMRRAQILFESGRRGEARAAYANAQAMGYSVEDDAHPLERDEMARLEATLQ